MPRCGFGELFDHIVDLFLIADVGLEEDAIAEFFDLFERVPAPLYCFEVVDADEAALFGKLNGGGGADTGA